MITEDYILKLIRLAAEFIVKALKLSKEGDFLTSEKTLENGLQDITGISLDTLKKLDAKALLGITGGDETSVFVLAKFLETLAEIEREKGVLDLYYTYLIKSLELYLSITNIEDYETEKPILEIYPMVREVLYDKDLKLSLIEFFIRIDNADEAGFLMRLMED
ncbi:MAG: hypothetical protein JW903_10080 [Clostridia bacterium]|nr:hypothetical protein [Clostridia bacterium]